MYNEGRISFRMGLPSRGRGSVEAHDSSPRSLRSRRLNLRIGYRRRASAREKATTAARQGSPTAFRVGQSLRGAARYHYAYHHYGGNMAM